MKLRAMRVTRIRFHWGTVALAAGAALGTLSVTCAPSGDQPPRQAAKAERLPWIGRAPDFSAPDETGKVRTLAEFRGKPIVLYFYPKDGTPGCTEEACAFRDQWDAIQATGAQVIGVSVDTVASHEAFKQKLNLPFPLLSDPEGKVLKAYGVPRSPKGYAARTTFIIDRRGNIRRIFPHVDPAVSAKQVIAVLEEMKRQGL